MTDKPKPPAPDLSKTRLPRHLEAADAKILRTPLTEEAKDTWMASLGFKDLMILRQATLRVHRSAVGPFHQADPTIAEIDEMIRAVGPVASENMLRRAVDEKLGEYDKGSHGHGVSNDADFRRRS